MGKTLRGLYFPHPPVSRALVYEACASFNVNKSLVAKSTESREASTPQKDARPIKEFSIDECSPILSLSKKHTNLLNIEETSSRQLMKKKMAKCRGSNTP
jgi:hypothetical protein